MRTDAAAFSLDGRDRISPHSIQSHSSACGRRTTISLGDGRTLNLEPELRAVAFLMSRFAENEALSDLAIAAAVCRDDGTLVHQLDDVLVGLPPDACIDAAVDPGAAWYRTLQLALQNVDVVVPPGAWLRRQAAEAVHDGFSHLDWGCARSDIDWQKIALPSDRLAHIRSRFGVLGRCRRAIDECHLVLDLLTQPGRPGHEPPLAQLLAAIDAEAVRLFAGDVPAAHMPALEKRGYRWSPGLNGAPTGFFVDRARDDARRERRFLARLLGRDEADLLERPLPADQRYRLP